VGRKKGAEKALIKGKRERGGTGGGEEGEGKDRRLVENANADWKKGRSKSAKEQSVGCRWEGGGTRTRGEVGAKRGKLTIFRKFTNFLLGPNFYK
jgi:hypothetical protein